MPGRPADLEIKPGENVFVPAEPPEGFETDDIGFHRDLAEKHIESANANRELGDSQAATDEMFYTGAEDLMAYFLADRMAAKDSYANKDHSNW